MKSEWQTKTLGDLCSFENGDRGENYPSKSVQTTSGIPFINAGHLAESGIDFSEMNYIARERFDLLGNGKIQSNDILFCLRGSLGKFASVGNLSEGAIASSLVIIRPRGAILNEFVRAYLQSDLCADMIRKFRNGAAQPNLSAGSLKKFSIPIPPLAEQRRIVGILDKAFEGIAAAKANAEKNLRNARRLFESYRESALSHRGKGWSEKSLGEICSINSALFDPRRTEFLDLLHVGAANIESKTGAFIDLKTAREEGLISGKFLFDDFTVLYSKIRPYLMKVARPDFKGLCSADMYPLAPVKNEITRDYLFHLLLTKRFTDYAIQGSARAGIPKVNREHLFAFRTWLPEVKQQHNVAAGLDELHAQAQRMQGIYEQKCGLLSALKKSLLHQAFTGNL